ncbi:MAG: hypothetical protein FJX06_16120 [Alphaproteobacteria bacterium]|nr:hypothetical protein [Alphaproteobacteria bacterium]
MANRDPLVMRWPQNIIPVRHVTLSRERAIVTGPPPIAGAAQRVTSPGATWRLTYEGVLAREASLATLRAVLARIEGRAQPIYVGPYDYAFGPVKRAGAVSPIFYTSAGGHIFSTGYRFVSSISDCTLAADASRGATEISLSNSPSAPLQAGDYFELAGRLHIIEELVGADARIWPRLRASYTTGQKIEIADPRMRAYLDGEATIQMQYGRWGETTLQFVEAPW